MKKYLSSYWIRSAFYSFLQRFSITFFGFINFVLLTRSITIAQLGSWALFLTITGIFEMTKSNLLKNAHVKFVSGSDDKIERTTIASSSLLINTAISVIFVLLILIFSGWLSSWFNTGSELEGMLKGFIPGILFMIFFAHLEAVQQSHLDFKGGFAGYFIRQSIFFFVIVVYKIMKIPLSLTALALYQSLSIGCGTIVLYFLSRKYMRHEFRPSRIWIRKIMGYGGYIFGSGMVANISTNLDQLLTGKFLNTSSVAYYNVASRINLLVDIPSYAASEIIFPKASRASEHEGKEKITYLFERMVAVLISFTVPTALFIIIVPRLVTVIIAGKIYAAAAPILQLYMITGIFRPIQNQSANLLNSIGKPRLVFFANILTLILGLSINYFCLLKIGFYGAAIGTLITSLLSFVFWYFVMRKEVDFNILRVLNYARHTYKTMYVKIRTVFPPGSK